MDYGWGTVPDCGDHFPHMKLVAHFRDLEINLVRAPKMVILHAVDKKTLYGNCVKVLNRRGLSNKSTSMWTDRLGGDGSCPCWRVLYKPSLSKRTSDLQWRILQFYFFIIFKGFFVPVNKAFLEKSNLFVQVVLLQMVSILQLKKIFTKPKLYPQYVCSVCSMSSIETQFYSTYMYYPRGGYNHIVPVLQKLAPGSVPYPISCSTANILLPTPSIRILFLVWCFLFKLCIYLYSEN